MFFESSGILRYSQEGDKYRLVLELDRDLARYYRSLIPKTFSTNGTRYAPHVTIVRPEKEIPPDLTAWGRYEGEEVPFLYSHEIHYSRNYFWLNVLCKRLEAIRLELGLPVSSEYTRPPEGFEKFFHTTIANTKLTG